MIPAAVALLAGCGGADAPPEPPPAPPSAEEPEPAVPAPAPSAPFQATGSAIGHCTAEERMRFSCPMKGGKILSLCEAPAGLSYRFGAPGALELRIPSEGYSASFERSRQSRGEDAERVTTSAWNDGHRYAVVVDRTEDQFEGSLGVRKGAEKLASLTCAGDVAADLTDLDGRFGGDSSTDTAWIGEWSGMEAELVVEARAGGLHVTGTSTWHGRNPGQIHTGELDGPLKRIDATHLTYAHEGCELTLTWKSADTLEGKSNTGCGGVNTTFSWEYVREP